MFRSFFNRARSHSRRFTLAAAAFTLCIGTALAAEPAPQFSWVSGSNSGGVDIDVSLGVYGQKGRASVEYTPGGRDSAISWTDNSGQLWLFGGRSKLAERPGVFNDIWMMDPARKTWTWVAGSQEPNQEPVFGPEGEFGPDYTPGSLISAQSWTDLDGNLWVFGGNNNNDRLTPNIGFECNANLWKFDVSLKQWAVMKKNEHRAGAVYGTRGAPSPDNRPGSRQWAYTWTGDDGRLWMFGGWGYSAVMGGYTYGSNLADLWVYDPATGIWTWKNGTSAVNHGRYFAEGGSDPVSLGSAPSYRERGATWKDSEGNLWLFGGRLHLGEMRYYNDAWKYDVAANTWTFVSGTKREWTRGTFANMPRLTHGVSGDKNVLSHLHTPGGRDMAAHWVSDDGFFYLFGGYGAGETEGTEGGLADLWKLDPATGQWAWAGGSKLVYQLGFYGKKNTPHADNLVGGHHSSAFWKDRNGKFWLFGGYGFNAYIEDQLNDLWTYNPNNDLWTWVGGNHYPSKFGWYGEPLFPTAENHPGVRTEAAMWAPAGKFVWMFGGDGFGFAGETGMLNDLWRYNTSTHQWTYIKGVRWTNHAGSYLVKGQPHFEITPSARKNPARWTDASGRLWMFGGLSDSEGTQTWSDLWVFHPSINCWEWVAGPSTPGSNGHYGTKGSPDPLNNPPARYEARTWVDKQGNLWMFGGTKQDYSVLGDMWKFDITTRQWTWMNGPSMSDESDEYGTQGSPASTNSPNAHFGSATWTDAQGNFWLYGSFMRSAVWMFNPNTAMWTWVDGPNSMAQHPPVYDTPGVPSNTATPGARTYATCWSDPSGDFWLFGGESNAGLHSDLWRYSPSTLKWTFVKGSTEPDALGNYGEKRSFLETNIPGARISAAAAQDPSGRMWLYGGRGYDYDPEELRLQGDLWEFAGQHLSASQDWELYE